MTSGVVGELAALRLISAVPMVHAHHLKADIRFKEDGGRHCASFQLFGLSLARMASENWNCCGWTVVPCFISKF